MSDWASTVAACDRVSLDTNAVIYFLDRTEPYFELVNELFDRSERGKLLLVVSTLVETELLVGPLRRHELASIESVRLLLDHFPGLSIHPIGRDVARIAAQLRADLGLGTPDALIAATAVASNSDAIVGNDRRCATRLSEPRYLYLSDYVAADANAK